MTEKQFENRVKKFLDNAGVWYIKFWGGGIFTKSGVPDLIICCSGFFIAVELKTNKGKVTALQQHTIKQINNADGLAFVLRPDTFEDFQNLIRTLKRF
jgi:Holliday junction resolvase